jgi:hypothetical protein
VSAGDYITGPRCLHPVKLYAKPGRVDEDPVCYRPLNHPGTKHLSRWAYLRDLERKARVKRERHPWWLAA